MIVEAMTTSIICSKDNISSRLLPERQSQAVHLIDHETLIRARFHALCARAGFPVDHPPPQAMH